jgi:hypothetical protein
MVRKKLHGGVIELLPIVALNDLNGAAKLSGDINSLNGTLKGLGPPKMLRTKNS